jgi:two-component system, chemotaxis family, sensor kinase CheA
VAVPHTDELLRDFESEAQERLERLEELLLAAPSAAPGGVRELVDGIRRELHTLKGNAGMMGLGDLQAAAHAMEDLVGDVESRRPRLQRLLAALDRLRALLKAVVAVGTADAAGTAGAIGAAGAVGAAGTAGVLGAAGTAGAVGTVGAPGPAGPAGAAQAADPAAAAPPTAGSGASALPAGGAGTEPGSGVRIPFATLDSLVDLLAEMVIARGRLAEALAHTRALRRGDEEGRAAWSEADEAHERVEGVLEELQQGVLRLRMVPLGSVFRQLGRIVHDTAAREGKRVRLLVEGGDTAIDKALLELAGEALGHLVRNAIIHGIEEPAERRRGGKDESGTLRLAAHATAREVLIDVEDDGRGVQVDALRAAAARGGAPLPRAEAALAGGAATTRDARTSGGAETPGSDQVASAAEIAAGAEAASGAAAAGVAGADVLELLFLPGLSTRAHADLGAGRGIGLAAVKRAVERRGGQVEVASEAGRGSLFRLRLPLSASIARALLVRSDGAKYALPLRAVLESRRLDAGDLHEINGGGALRWRGQVIPALDLGCTFGTASLRRREGHAVIVEEHGRTRALVVDQVLDIREVVVKTLDRLLAELPGVAGSTVLGDGSAVLVLDPASLVAMSPLLDEGTATPRALP